MISLKTSSVILKFIFLSLYKMNAEFVDLIDFENDYEINTTYPYEIKNKRTGKILKESIMNNGYYCVRLNGVTYVKHRLIAKQFILNPNNYPCVDHINHNRNDNHISNLRWVSSSENNKNKSFYKGVNYAFYDHADFEDDDIIVIDQYNGHEIEDYYYDMLSEKFLFDTGVNYRELHVNFNKNGYAFVWVKDIENKYVAIYINKFKRIHDLIY